MGLGTIISFLFGREPGTLPDDIARELAPATIAVCGFLLSYEVWDVMAVGVAKERAIALKSYKDIPDRMPEKVYLSQRAQSNQVEQISVFLVGTFGCALLVDGRVADILGMAWGVLRRLYAAAYRDGSGKNFKEMGLAKYTIPCYFIVNSMLMAVVVQSVRCL